MGAGPPDAVVAARVGGVVDGDGAGPASRLRGHAVQGMVLCCPLCVWGELRSHPTLREPLARENDRQTA